MLQCKACGSADIEAKETTWFEVNEDGSYGKITDFAGDGEYVCQTCGNSSKYFDQFDFKEEEN